MKPFEYILPATLNDALQSVRQDKTRAKAGGVDLIDLMKEGLEKPDRIVHLRPLEELSGIRQSDGLRIGPNITLSELSGHDALKSSYRALAQAAGGAATPQIRNMATLGGNLCQRPRCWYFRSADFHCTRKGGTECFAYNGENQYHAVFGNQDGCAIVHPSATAVALIALDATLVIRSSDRERSVRAADFFVAPKIDIRKENVLQPDELITEIHLPPVSSNRVSFYDKVKEKQSFDWPIAETAVAFNWSGGVCRDVRIVLGAVSPTPLRVETAEKFLEGKKLNLSLAREAAALATAGATPLSGNGYKLPIIRASVARTLCWAVGIDPFHSP